MTLRRINWPLWAGFLLSLVAFFSYFAVFVQFPATRDFPWANLVLFLLAAVLLVIGIRRGFAADRPRRSKIAAVVLTAFSVLIIGFFVFAVLIAARWLPASAGAPQVGQKAPEFTLTDANNKPVSLAELLSTPIDGNTPPKGVLLIFYRGYW
jgi:predicted membrane channel-forming protein YqfA (hemolysin III family)